MALRGCDGGRGQTTNVLDVEAPLERKEEGRATDEMLAARSWILIAICLPVI